jgi:hypothetical protein
MSLTTLSDSIARAVRPRLLQLRLQFQFQFQLRLRLQLPLGQRRISLAQGSPARTTPTSERN